MMNKGFMYPMPHGMLPPAGHHHHGSSHGFCRACCRPVHACCCHDRRCHREIKELRVIPETISAADDNNTTASSGFAGKLVAFAKVRGVTSDEISAMTSIAQMQALKSADVASTKIAAALTNQRTTVTAGVQKEFLGGCRPIHLSVEYMQTTDTAGAVIALVQDADETLLAWGKIVGDSAYHIKENIITTHPGAMLIIMCVNATARLRWCEVFSC